jgi:hypothetical protein
VQSPILGGTTEAVSLNAAANRSINLYPEATKDGKTGGFLRRCPGLILKGLIGDGPIRALHAAGDYLFVISGSTLYRLNSSYTATLIGTVAVSADQVVMASSATQVFIACGNRGYIYTLATAVLVEITDTDFEGAQSVGYLDGYFVFAPPGAQTVWVTSLLEGTEVDALDFASAETEADDILAVVVSHREVWLFGETSTEVWYNQAAGSGFPLARIQGASIEVGIASTYAWARLDNTIFWLANDGIVYRANGYVPVRVSTHAVEQWIETNATLSDAVAYGYRVVGHQFFVVSFTGTDNTWVFDVATGEWHERRSWVDGQWDRHRSNCYAKFGSDHVVGDFSTGGVYTFSNTTYRDSLIYQRWVRRWRALPPGSNDLKRQTHHSLQIGFEAGVGLDGATTTQGSNPQVMLRWSNDGGHTWSNELWREIGRIGDTGQRAIWRRLGDTDKLRDRIYEISGTDPVAIAITEAILDVEAKDA